MGIFGTWTILLMLFPPLYIALRFVRWSLKSLEKEMVAAEEPEHGQQPKV
jgi:hypothetical protein